MKPDSPEGSLLTSGTVAEALSEIRAQLESAGISEPAIDARLLVTSGLRISRTALAVDAERPISDQERSQLADWLRRRVKREPLQYITGRCEFYGREFEVNRRVLIPRPETELLVEQALAFLRERKLTSPKILDIGTGSGILAVTLALEVPGAELVATDVSTPALAVARVNAAKHDVEKRIRFEQTSFVDDLEKGFDLVVSNPPYVLSGFLDGPDVQPELKHEPRVALDGGSDGMQVYRDLIPGLRDVLADDGAAYLEIDPPVTESCMGLAREAFPTASVSVLTDLAGLDRCLAIEPTGQSI